MQLEASGRTVTSDRLELKKSYNVKSSDELRAEKQGTVSPSGAGKYNSVSGRGIGYHFEVVVAVGRETVVKIQ